MLHYNEIQDSYALYTHLGVLECAERFVEIVVDCVSYEQWLSGAVVVGFDVDGYPHYRVGNNWGRDRVEYVIDLPEGVVFKQEELAPIDRQCLRDLLVKHLHELVDEGVIVTNWECYGTY